MDDDEETYAPVCQWTSVRFFLILCMIMGWVTIAVDYNQAFVQAILDKPVYMVTPSGFQNRFGFNGCLRLKRSLYGSKYAPRDWYLTLRTGLLSLGFKESSTDPCLLYRKDCICVNVTRFRSCVVRD